MKRPVILMALFLSFSLLHSAEFRYKVTIGDSNHISIWKTEKINGRNNYFNFFMGTTETAVNDESGNTVFISITNQEKGNNITIEKKGGYIYSYGVFKGREVSKTAKLQDDVQWQQNTVMQGGDFILSGKDKMEFVMVRLSDFEPMVMQLERKGTEVIDVMGRKTDVVRVEMRVAGFLSFFWKADFLFRKNDGVAVGYKGPQGPPGSPELTIEMISEK